MRWCFFLQKYPSGLHVEEAKDLLGDVNTEILLSNYRSPEKQEYIVRSGDVLAKIANQDEDHAGADHAHE